MSAQIVLCLAILAFSCGQAHGQEYSWPQNSLVGRIDAYLKPYVQTGNFSGVVLAKQNWKLLFLNGYGFADRKDKIPSTFETRFHIASLSMQFTAAAALRLVDGGQVSCGTWMGSLGCGDEGAGQVGVAYAQ